MITYAFFKRVILPLVSEKPHLIGQMMAGYFSTLVLKRPRLKMVDFMVTGECDMNTCVMCFASKFIKKNEKLLSLCEIKDVWQESKRLGAVGAVFLGGEPFVRDDFMDILEACEPKKHVIAVITNALSLDRDKIRALKNMGVSFLSMSLDHFDRDMNDRIRGDRSHQKVMDAIGLCREFGLPFELSVVVSHSNVGTLEDYAKKAEKLGARSVSVTAMVPVGKWGKNEAEILKAEDWELIERLIRLYPILRSDYHYTYYLRANCPGGKEKLCFGPYGDVMTCSVNPMSFGNIREEKLAAIWERIQNTKAFNARRIFPKCVVAGDPDYYDRYLREIADIEINPVSYKKFRGV